MAEEILTGTGSQFLPLKGLLLTDVTLQISLAVLLIGIVGIFIANRKR